MRWSNPEITKLLPRKLFLTSGIGEHSDKLVSFELALRAAGISGCNLVNVTSIVPPGCQLIPRSQGTQLLSPGQILFCVLSRNSCNSPKQISAGIGVAIPNSEELMGFLYEYHADQDRESTRFQVERGAAMLFSSAYPGKNFKLSSIVETALGQDGIWTSVVAAAVFVL